MSLLLLMMFAAGPLPTPTPRPFTAAPPVVSLAPGITVTVPRHDADAMITWLYGSGQTEQVEWFTTGAAAREVRIALYAAECKHFIQPLIDPTPNDGNERVPVPAEVVPGIYAVRVDSADPDASGCSGDFRISRSPFIITNPGSGVVWTVGRRHQVLVSTLEDSHVHLRVFLTPVDTARDPLELQRRAQNLSPISVQVPRSVSPGLYRIELVPLEGSASGMHFYSEAFTVAASR